MKDFLYSLQEKLEADRVTPLMARDGILESYVITNRKALAAGAERSVLDLSDEEVLGRMSEMMRELFQERGADFDNPTVSELRSIRHTMDLKLRITDLPLDVNEMHDIVCEMLLARTEESFEEGIVQPQRLDEPLTEYAISSTESVAAFPSQETLPPESSAAPVQPQTQSFEETEEKLEIRSPFAASLAAKLGFDWLSPQDARDGIIESFVTAQAGVQSAGVIASEGEIETYVKGMMRDILSELGSSFDEPSLDALAESARRMGEKLDMIRMPNAVRVRHNETCEVLLNRAHRLVDALAGKPVAGMAVPFQEFAPSEEFTPQKEPVPEETGIEADVLGSIDRLAETPESEPEPRPRLQPQAEPTPQFERMVEPPVEKPVLLSLEDILTRVRSELQEMVSRELRTALDKEKMEPVKPIAPPAGIAAKVEGHIVFLAWLDSFEQPGYNVYRRAGERWVKLTPVPLSRPSFRILMEEEGEEDEICFAVSVIGSQGTESELSPEVRVRI